MKLLLFCGSEVGEVEVIYRKLFIVLGYTAGISEVNRF